MKKMIRKEIDRSGIERFVPEGYSGRVEPIACSKGRIYVPDDFENGLEILLYFSRMGGYKRNPDSIKRCRVVDRNARRVKTGYGEREALRVLVKDAWFITGGVLKKREIRKPDVKFLYESIKGAYEVRG